MIIKNQYICQPIIGQLLTVFIRQPQGNLYIDGPAESGISATLDFLVNQIYDQKPNLNLERLDKDGYKIDSIRQLNRRLSLTRADLDYPRLVVIDDCHLLNDESQNALLKSIEEPGLSTHFLLGSSQTGQVLPTILSRCLKIRLRKPPRSSTRDYFVDKLSCSDQEIDRAYLIANGWPAAMSDLLQSQSDSQVKRQIEFARQFLVCQGVSERLIFLAKNSTKSQPEFIKELLVGLRRSCRAALVKAANENSYLRSWQWRRRLLVVEKMINHKDRGGGDKAIELSLSIL